jgi:hypothetical protein
MDPELAELPVRMAILTLHAVLKRLTVSFDMPFRDFATFRAYWKRNGADGKYQARRDILNELFNPLLDRLVELQAQGKTSTLADAVSPRRITGWARVDAEITRAYSLTRAIAVTQSTRFGRLRRGSRWNRIPPDHYRSGDVLAHAAGRVRCRRRSVCLTRPGAPSRVR